MDLSIQSLRRRQINIHSEMECQPIVVNGILYAVSPQLKLFALNAADRKKDLAI